MIKKLTACVIAFGLGAFTLVGSASVASADPDNVCDVRMIEWGVNAPGTDTPAKANYEFKRLLAPVEIDVEGWWVQDSYPHVYKLEASKLPAGSPFRKLVDHDADPATPPVAHFVMPAGSNVYVYNGTGTDGNPTNLTAALYANLGHHHNNAGDTLSVRSDHGVAIDWVAYTPYRTRHFC